MTNRRSVIRYVSAGKVHLVLAVTLIYDFLTSVTLSR